MNAAVVDAAHPVQMQLEAYNARDISFMQRWAEDCLYYAFPDTLPANGATANDPSSRSLDLLTRLEADVPLV